MKSQNDISTMEGIMAAVEAIKKEKWYKEYEKEQRRQTESLSKKGEKNETR